MPYWEFDHGIYEIVSFYSLGEDAWTYELTGPIETATLIVRIPDSTPDEGPFTPSSSASVQVVTFDGLLPWPILIRFAELIESSGHITVGPAGPMATGDVHLAHNTWTFAERHYEFNAFSVPDPGRLCYVLRQTVPAAAPNNFIEVSIPEPVPDGPPLTAPSADPVIMRSHGKCTLPWPVFRRLLDLVDADGHLTNESETRNWSCSNPDAPRL